MSTRPQPPDRCPELARAIKESFWLLPGHARESADAKRAQEVIKLLKQHLDRSTCRCASKEAVQISVGVAYFELFLTLLDRFQRRVLEAEEQLPAEESRHQRSAEEELDPKENPHVTPHPSATDRTSRLLSYSLASLVNVEGHQKLLQPLENAMVYWKRATSSSSRLPDHTEIVRLRVVEYLNAAFHVFGCYGRLDQQEECSRLTLKLTRIETARLNAICMYGRVLIDRGEIVHARRIIFDKGTEYEKSVAKQTDDSYELYLFRLLKIELELGTAQATKAGTELKAFLGCDYLKKMTLHRYYLKSLAQLLATKFLPKHYEYADDHSEFIESLQSASLMVKRSQPTFYTESAGSPASTPPSTQDPVWYRFAAYAHAVRAFEVSSYFCLGIGQPNELVGFFYNPLLRVCRSLGFISFVQRLLNVGAQIDLACDRRESAALKLQQAFAITTAAGPCRKPTLTDAGDNNDGDDDLKIKIVSASVATDDEPHDHGGCMHERDHIPWAMKRATMKSAYSDCQADGDTEIVLLPSYQAQPSLSKITNIELQHIDLTVTLLECSPEKPLVSYLRSLASSSRPLQQLCTEVGLSDPATVSKVCNPANPLSFTVLARLVCLLMSAKLSPTKHHQCSISLAQHLLSYVPSVYVENYINRVLCTKFALRYLRAQYHVQQIRPDRIEFDSHRIEQLLAEYDNGSQRQQQTERSLSPLRNHEARLNIRNARGAPKKEVFKMEGLKEYFDEYHKNGSPIKRTTRSQRACRRQLQQQADSAVPTLELENERELGRNRSQPDIVGKPSKGGQQRSAQPLTPDKLAAYLKTLTISPLKGQQPERPISLLTALRQLKTVHDFKEAARTCLLYVKGHPPAALYTGLNRLLAELYLSREIRSTRCAGYYLAESATGVLVRYKALRIAEKKERRHKRMKLDASQFRFGSDGIEGDLPALLDQQLEQLPDGWRVLQINAVRSSCKNTTDLILTRFEKGQRPIILKIVANPDKFTKDFVAELKEIISLSNVSIANREASTFWRMRYSLDSRLRALLEGVQSAWLGPFKSLLVGRVADDKYRSVVDRMMNHVLKTFGKVQFLGSDVLRAMLEAYPLLSPGEFRTALAAVLIERPATLFDECIEAVEKEFKKAYANCQARAELLERMRPAPVALVLDNYLEQFPFESLPCVREVKQEIFRVPSLLMLSAMLGHFRESKMLVSGADEQDVFYLLNPANNLQTTANKFKERFETRQQWRGSINRPPESQKLARALETNDIYIFFGHGSGSTYYRQMSDNLEGLTLHSASIVMGCSSGRLMAEGPDLESYGTAHRFLLNGSPCYVGALWDVTDRDIDKFADRMLGNWMAHWNSADMPTKGTQPSIAWACTEARDSCKLRYLIGAAPVVFGLPIHTLTNAPRID